MSINILNQSYCYGIPSVIPYVTLGDIQMVTHKNFSKLETLIYSLHFTFCCVNNNWNNVSMHQCKEI
jgi:hypothetical protein